MGISETAFSLASLQFLFALFAFYRFDPI
jgi:hypothetical protein